ncbi:MAG: hypothetical protein RL518_2319 [Pseudomonadota bacterium]|jgi:hypothetical protein
MGMLERVCQGVGDGVKRTLGYRVGEGNGSPGENERFNKQHSQDLAAFALASVVGAGMVAALQKLEDLRFAKMDSTYALNLGKEIAYTSRTNTLLGALGTFLNRLDPIAIQRGDDGHNVSNELYKFENALLPLQRDDKRVVRIVDGIRDLRVQLISNEPGLSEKIESLGEILRNMPGDKRIDRE